MRRYFGRFEKRKYLIPAYLLDTLIEDSMFLKDDEREDIDALRDLNGEAYPDMFSSAHGITLLGTSPQDCFKESKEENPRQAVSLTHFFALPEISWERLNDALKLKRLRRLLVGETLYFERRWDTPTVELLQAWEVVLSPLNEIEDVLFCFGSEKVFVPKS